MINAQMQTESNNARSATGFIARAIAIPFNLRSPASRIDRPHRRARTNVHEYKFSISFSSPFHTDATPELLYWFSEQTLQPGPTVSLKCVAIGNPPPQFTWTLDGFPVSVRIAASSEAASEEYVTYIVYLFRPPTTSDHTAAHIGRDEIINALAAHRISEIIEFAFRYKSGRRRRALAFEMLRKINDAISWRICLQGT